MNLKHYINLVEAAEKKLVQEPLKFNRQELNPYMSKETLDLHFGKLAKAYVDRFNKGEGDMDFNYGGATLHNIFFAQLTPKSKKPSGASLELINTKYDNFNSFQEEFFKQAMTIQGSGWIYLSNKGDIEIIKNHNYRDNMKIALLVDWWEHAFVLDYGSDKKRYLDNIFKIIDWTVINDRLQG